MKLRSSLSRFLRHNKWTWRYGFNLAPVLAYRKSRQTLSSEIARIASELRERGIALSSVDRFAGLPELFEELVAAVAAEEAAQSSVIAEARAEAANDSSVGDKTFMHMLLGKQPKLDLSCVYARVALCEALLHTSNAYFGMLTQMRYYNVWRTFAAASPARESQLWHRDRDDLQITKVFIYLSDVGPEAGPLTYAPGTHLLGRLGADPEGFIEGGVRRSNDDQMAKVVPRDEWVTATGARGTIVFADTHGYHKGGLATSAERLLFTSMYVSNASQVRELFCDKQRRSDRNGFSDAQSFAARLTNS